jgi:uncharacterized protein YbjT (DUF2867 family)
MQTRTACLFGATGLVGSHLLNKLADDPQYHEVKVFVRRLPEGIPSSKVRFFQIDFDYIEDITKEISGDDIYIALGTTMAAAGSKKAFWKVDFTYCAEITKIVDANGAKRLLFVSSAGANKNSLIYYSRVKGLIEAFLIKSNIPSVIIFRPNFLEGNRKEKRPLEIWMKKINQKFPWIYSGVFRKFSPIPAEQVANAMIFCAHSSRFQQGRYIMDSENMKSTCVK